MDKIKQVIGKIKADPNKYLLLGLVFVLPFDRIPSFDAFGITFRFSLLFSGLIILRFLYLLLRKRINIKVFAPYKVLIFFIIWIFLLVPESIDLKRGLMVAIFNTFTIITAISVSFIFDKKYIKPIITALFASSIIAVFFGLYQYPADLLGVKPVYTGLLERYRFMVFGFPRIQAFSYEPLYFAAYLLLPISVTVSLLLFDKKRLFDIWLIYLLLAAYSLAIFLTSSRGGIYSMIALLVAALLSTIITKRFSGKKFLLIVSIILISFLISFFIINNFNEKSLRGVKNVAAPTYTEQITKTSLNKEDDRATSRILALEILKKDKIAWVLGVGPGQYGPFVRNNLLNSSSERVIVNNLTIELFVELGVIGLSAIVAFLALLLLGLFKVIRKSNDNEIKIFAVALFCYLICQAIQYQSYSTLYIVIIWLTAGLSLALISLFKKSNK